MTLKNIVFFERLHRLNVQNYIYKNTYFLYDKIKSINGSQRTLEDTLSCFVYFILYSKRSVKYVSVL